MQAWHIVVIFIIVFAVVIGNIMLLKKTANMEFKKTSTDKADHDDDNNDESPQKNLKP
ncbi:DUF2897 family protein [Pseudoalteromonas sp.]|uniref:DUF2897 family protein n=1 Tax=unclassified Pseudoalteromonas TaxID=194690 RepID=UPI003F9D83E1